MDCPIWPPAAALGLEDVAGAVPLGDDDEPVDPDGEALVPTFVPESPPHWGKGHVVLLSVDCDK
jgi:hypothetical protein